MYDQTACRSRNSPTLHFATVPRVLFPSHSQNRARGFSKQELCTGGIGTPYTRFIHFCNASNSEFSQISTNIFVFLHTSAPWTPIWKPRKALLASVLRTKLTAPKTKPSGRSEAARPRGVAKRRCTMHAALTVRVGAALSQKIYADDATAPHSKNQPKFVIFFRTIAVLFSNGRWFFKKVVKNSRF